MDHSYAIIIALFRGGNGGRMDSAIIDTHLHLIYRERLSYPWLASVAALDRDFPYERYHAEARRCGVTDAIHMEVDVAPSDIEAETRNVGALAVQARSLLRGAISSCRPEDESFPAFLERQLANPVVKGFRRVLHVVPGAVSESEIFRRNLRRLAGSGRPFDLCVRPDQIEKAIALADLAPDVQFVLDHCGVPAIKDRAEHPWRERIVEIARRPNVAVKISGVVAYADATTWTVDDIRPYVEHAIESFGWDRVVWGSDWPVCTLTASLSTWMAAIHAITLGCSPRERESLFSANARRIWRLPS
jgi:predicted TIM-barrel fold metal-dependent hydrolase